MGKRIVPSDAATRRVGRPRNARPSVKVEVRIPADDYDQLAKMAARAGVAPSAFLKRVAALKVRADMLSELPVRLYKRPVPMALELFRFNALLDPRKLPEMLSVRGVYCPLNGAHLFDVLLRHKLVRQVAGASVSITHKGYMRLLSSALQGER